MALLLLDINMPIMSELDVCKTVQEIYDRYNNQVSAGDSGSAINLSIVRPVICFLSQYDRKTMVSFITPSEKADCYLEKPLPL